MRTCKAPLVKSKSNDKEKHLRFILPFRLEKRVEGNEKHTLGYFSTVV